MSYKPIQFAGRRLMAVCVVVATVLVVGASPARAGFPWITFSLTDGFENPALWSNDFGDPRYPCSWGVVSTAPFIRAGTHKGAISTCTSGFGTLGRYVTVPAGSTQCGVGIWRNTHTFDTVTKKNSIRIDVIEPSTWSLLGSKVGTANLTQDIAQWRQYTTPLFSLNGLTTSRVFFVRVMQVGTGTSQVLDSDLDDMGVVCF